MKKLLLLLCVVAFGFTSCKKCQECTYAGQTEEYCEDDFDSKDEYEASIELLEALGADCK